MPLEAIRSPRNSMFPDFGPDRQTVLDCHESRTTLLSLHPDEYVDSWVTRHLRNTKLNHDPVSLADVAGWRQDPATGNIAHESGRFFLIVGLKVRHRTGRDEIEWDQPIIDQPEVGILGILAKKFAGVLHFCLQAKEEPGNINSIQLAPTVQATYSNYTRTHGGKIPLFIELFLDPPPSRIIYSRLQAEDGGRFLYKSNKNMIVSAGDDVGPEPGEAFVWLTLRQIGLLMRRDNLINSCARSVLACMI